MAVAVVTGGWFVFLPPVPFTTSYLSEVCLFDSGTSASGRPEMSSNLGRP
jgi:hypothetical protein